MSWVTVKGPYAPQPLACMRRSGITSRSKCAIFSISQMSCSSAGPRGPAVMMLVLSATGAPVALVNRSDLDMLAPELWMWRTVKVAGIRACATVCANPQGEDDGGLPAPGGSADHAAEIAAGEVRVLVGKHVGLDVTERLFRLVLVAV